MPPEASGPGYKTPAPGICKGRPNGIITVKQADIRSSSSRLLIFRLMEVWVICSLSAALVEVRTFRQADKAFHIF